MSCDYDSMDLAIPSFAIAIIGIALQLADAFPQHRQARQTIVVMAIGVFIGAALSGLLGAKYELTGNVDGRYVVLFALIGGAIAFGLFAVLLGQKEKREIAGAIAACFGLAFLLAGFVIAAGSARGPSLDLSTDDWRVLAQAADRRGDYEAATRWYRTAAGQSQSPTVSQALSNLADAEEARQAQAINQ